MSESGCKSRRIASHTENRRTTMTIIEHFHTFSLKRAELRVQGGGRGVRCGVCTLKSCCCICPLGALCVAPYKKTSSSALRVRFVSRSTSFSLSPLFNFFFLSVFHILFALWYIYFLFVRLYCLLFGSLGCNLILIYVLYYAHLHKL